VGKFTFITHRVYSAAATHFPLSHNANVNSCVLQKQYRGLGGFAQIMIVTEPATSKE
jgi:hypothetical protein